MYLINISNNFLSIQKSFIFFLIVIEKIGTFICIKGRQNNIRFNFISYLIYIASS